MGAALPVMAVAGVAASAAGTYMQGEATSAADQYQAQRLDRAAQYGKVQAVQTSAQGLEKLNVTLGNIDAVRAAGNVDPSSPTTTAIRDRTSFLSERDTGIRVENILAQASQNESDAAYLRDASGYALTMGMVGAGATLGKGIGQTNFSTFG
jgi:hypothetical protein